MNKKMLKNDDACIIGGLTIIALSMLLGPFIFLASGLIILGFISLPISIPLLGILGLGICGIPALGICGIPTLGACGIPVLGTCGISSLPITALPMLCLIRGKDFIIHNVNSAILLVADCISHVWELIGL